MKILIVFQEQSFKDERYQYCLVFNKTHSLPDQLLILLHYPQLIILCDTCQRQLTLTTSILLESKPCQYKDYCLSCFCKLDQVSKNCHYYIRPSFNHCITEDQWNYRAELLLINGLQKYGYGNWANIKNYMDYHQANFTPEEIEQHYKTFYQTVNMLPIFLPYPLQTLNTNPYTSYQALSPSLQVKQSQTPKTQNIQGYNQKRNEHMFDYDPTIEELICDLEFIENQSIQQRQMKIQLLKQYNVRLKERRKREEFVKEHRLLHEEHQKEMLKENKNKSVWRRNFTNINRFMNFEESENILNHLTIQSTLHGSASSLMRHRRTLEEPLIESAYQSLKNIHESRKRQHYRDAPQLKIHQFGLKDLKRSFSARQKEISIEKARRQLKKVNFLPANASITDLSSN